MERYVGGKHQHYIPEKPAPETEFIGKYFIPNGSRPLNELNKNYVTEREISMFARPNIYQVIFANSLEEWISKPESYLRQGRLNLIINPNTYVILDIEYF